MAKEPLLITGATSGVGLSLCRYFSDRYTVIAMGRGQERLESLFSGSPNVVTVAADLESETETAAALVGVLERYPTVPYLINNAGVLVKGHVAELTTGGWLRSVRVNALAPAQIMAAVVPGMIAAGFGRIINVTSGAPFNCAPGFAAYSASKAGLNALTVTAGKELSAHNIKVNLMSPGPVRSNMAPQAALDPSVCHSTAEYLLELPADGPTGRFFWLGRELPLAPDLGGVRWLDGEADERYPRIPVRG